MCQWRSSKEKERLKENGGQMKRQMELYENLWETNYLSDSKSYLHLSCYDLSLRYMNFVDFTLDNWLKGNQNERDQNKYF